MTEATILTKGIESLQECVVEVPKSMFGAFPGISTDVEREEEDRV